MRRNALSIVITGLLLCMLITPVGAPADAHVSLARAAQSATDSGDIHASRAYPRVMIADLKLAIGDITTVAGNRLSGFSGDGGPALAASLDYPTGVATDGSNNLFLLDLKNNRIRRVDWETGIITTVAGNGTAGYSGDSGPATEASLHFFTGGGGAGAIAVDRNGSLFISDTFNHRVRRVDATTGIITTVAGNGVIAFAGDGGPATEASLNFPTGIAVDQAGNLLIADAGNLRIRRVDAATGILMTVVGCGESGFSGDGVPATNARLSFVLGIVCDRAGNLVIADYDNRRIRRVDVSTGLIATVAGNGLFGVDGDGGPATSASLSGITGVAVDRQGHLFLVDESRSLVRRVDAVTGIITRVAGNGTVGFSGDDGPATGASLNFPAAIGVSPAGDLLIADTRNQVIRLIKGVAAREVVSPQINGAEVRGKKLFVYGANFVAGAELLMNDARQKKTFNDETNPTTLLVARKSGRLITPGEIVTLQVRNPDGALSNEYHHTRPAP